ncbi:MAG TPA: hypothetical protein VNW29_02620 [Candidatus Sulfotelmatobacter sp.]|jgi:hypothetical protein|nr:hypothetical protein [Candidatus Sulfotelmatobacter sp.]
MPDSLPAAKLSLSFAKLVATPTEIAWSQAYNAGNLFVCLSITIEEDREELSLQALGKEIFNILQSEFFTLQEKNIANIKTAIQTSFDNSPKHITVGLALAYFKEATLLVFIAGSGKIIMKRGEKVGVLLAKQDANDGVIKSASGFVENSDTIILETGPFAQGISQETVIHALDLALPNDIVEALSPQIHKQDNGAQAAIVISYRGASATIPMEEPESEEEQTLGSLYQVETEYSEKELLEEMDETKHKPIQFPKLPKFHQNFKLSHRRKLFLNIALILILLLILSIFFTVKKYNNDKQQNTFQAIYPTAQQYYSQGEGLETVNASLSQDNYRKAEKLLKDGETKLPKNSKNYQQIADLLAQIENKLQNNSTGQTTNVTQAQAPSHSLLAVEQSTNNGLAFGEDTNDVYIITNKGITTESKNDGSIKDSIKNNTDWISPVAVIPYEGNIYVLDQKKGLLKFVASSGGFGMANYFSNTSPDLSQTTGMAIDGSVWLIFKDGTIMQYIKGKSNGFAITGLLKPLSNPTKIVTNITMESIYILDNGNSRIVQIDKNGKYQNAFSAPVIANAKDLSVSEKEKIIQILSQGKVWELHF